MKMIVNIDAVMAAAGTKAIEETVKKEVAKEVGKVRNGGIEVAAKIEDTKVVNMIRKEEVQNEKTIEQTVAKERGMTGIGVEKTKRRTIKANSKTEIEGPNEIHGEKLMERTR